MLQLVVADVIVAYAALRRHLRERAGRLLVLPPSGFYSNRRTVHSAKFIHVDPSSQHWLTC
jgi:hypothetical protein